MIIYTYSIYILSALYGALILYFYLGWKALKEFNSKSPDTIPGVRVSVIVPVRNEADHIIDLLDDLAAQQYPHSLMEVIIVDDFSDDKTADLVRGYTKLQVRLIHLADYMDPSLPRQAHKKIAIETAVQLAKGDWIITTDADCRMGPDWVSTTMQYAKESDVVFVAGPVGLFYDTSFLGKFQTLDFISLVGIAAASIHNGFYNLCNGANLAYAKAAFLEVDGYANAKHTPSGDDMMLMHKIGKRFPGKVGFLKNRQAIVRTFTAPDFSTFWQQRLRWTSKAGHYEDKRITVILAMAYLCNLTLAFNVMAGAFHPQFLHLAMWQFLLKIGVDTLFAYSVARFFKTEQLLWNILPMQILHIIYIIAIAPASLIGGFEWKGRRYS